MIQSGGAWEPTGEYEQRVATVGDNLIMKYGVEIMAERGHHTLDLFDYAINRAIELEWFIDQVEARFTDLGEPTTKAMQHEMTELSMLELRVRQAAFKMIMLRRGVIAQHGDQGRCEHVPIPQS